MTIAERVNELCKTYNVKIPLLLGVGNEEKTKEESFFPDKLPIYITYTFNSKYKFQPNRCKFYRIERK